MTREELERAQCVICGKPSTEWLEVYVCSHPPPGEMSAYAALVAKAVFCGTCRRMQFGLSVTERADEEKKGAPS